MSGCFVGGAYVIDQLPERNARLHGLASGIQTPCISCILNQQEGLPLTWTPHCPT